MMFPSSLRTSGSVLTASVLLCSICGVLYAWSIFIIPLEQIFGWSRNETSFTFTLMVIFFSVGMILSGQFTSRFGIPPVALSGAGLLSTGLLMASEASSLMTFYVGYGVLAGLGIGLLTLLPPSVCLPWYPTHKGLISGLLSMSIAFGTLLIGSFAADTLVHLIGVQSTLRILGIGSFLIILIICPFLRLPPDNHNDSSSRQNGLSLGQVLRTPLYWFFWCWIFALQAGGLMIIAHIVPYALEQGLTGPQAAAGLGVYAIANGLGRLLFGFIIDSRGRLFSMLANALVMTCGLLILAGLTYSSGSIACFLAGTVLVAASYGGVIPHVMISIIALFGPGHFSSIYGFSSTPMMIASLFGPFLGGILRVYSGSYMLPLLVAVGMTLPAILASFLLGKAKPHEKI